MAKKTDPLLKSDGKPHKTCLMHFSDLNGHNIRLRQLIDEVDALKCMPWKRGKREREKIMADRICMGLRDCLLSVA